MSSLWTVNRYFSLFFHYVQNATAVTTEKPKELSEYKAIYMIQDHLYLVYGAIQKDTQEISKIPFICLTSTEKRKNPIDSRKRQSSIF